MSENKEILPDFQAFTIIEDIQGIFCHDETEWDLTPFVSEVLSPDTQSFQPSPDSDIVVDDDGNTPPVTLKRATDMIEVGNNVGVPPPKKISIENSACTQEHFPSASGRSGHEKILKFSIAYGDRVIRIEMLESGTIGDLKIKLQSELKIAPCRQILSKLARLDEYENTPFAKLSLPDENLFYLTIKENDGGFTVKEENSVIHRLNDTYTLNVKFEGKTYNLKYQGTKTILQVKDGFSTLINLDVCNQIWSGWPPNIDDNTMLAHSGINYPEHDLTVRQNLQVNRQENNWQIVQIDNEDDEFEVASDSIRNHISAKMSEPLIPENVKNELVGSIMFADNFTARYGHLRPTFYRGTLEAAIEEAFAKPAKDRKILAIYLHHDATDLTNVFCTKLLGFNIVMQMYEKNFVLWGWDITFESNRTKLQQSVNQCLGCTAAIVLRSIPVCSLPAIVLMIKIRSSIEIFSIVNGNVGVNELLASFVKYVEAFTEHQRVDIKEEQESADRAKEDARAGRIGCKKEVIRE